MTEVTSAKKIIEYPPVDPDTGFDYRVKIINAETGKLVKYQPYTLHANGNEKLLERPIGSGNAFTQNGAPAGRFDFSTPRWKKLSEEHIQTKPIPVDKLSALEQENEELQRELDTLRAEAKEKAKSGAKEAATVQKA